MIVLLATGLCIGAFGLAYVLLRVGPRGQNNSKIVAVNTDDKYKLDLKAKTSPESSPRDPRPKPKKDKSVCNVSTIHLDASKGRDGSLLKQSSIGEDPVPPNYSREEYTSRDVLAGKIEPSGAGGRNKWILPPLQRELQPPDEPDDK